MAVALASSAPMSANMLVRLSDDIAASGPINAVIRDHPASGSPLYCLRALAGVRYLVLTGQAPELKTHLRGLTAHMGEPSYDERTWELFRETLLGNPVQLRAAMDRPVQQHQPGRAGVLLNGLTTLAAPRVRLLELGACAGLNLLLDRYRWFGPGWEWGDPSSPVRLTANGKPPPPIEIVERAGCDQDPRDPSDSDHANILRSFIPHERDVDQLDLDDAIALAAISPLRIEKADAADWLERILESGAPDRSVRTVVWHSLFWGYLSPEEQTRIEKALSRAATRIPIARISYEPHSWLTAPRLQITLYS
jgi:hypothetical protein